MTSTWQMLAGNFAVVALFVLGWGHARFWLRRMAGATRRALFGLVMGLGSIATMIMASEVTPGVYLDLRSSLLALTAFFGGPVAAIVAAALAAACRAAMGGEGVWLGLAIIASSTLIGFIGFLLTTQRGPSTWQGPLLGLSIGLLGALALFWTPPEMVLAAATSYVLPTLFLNTAATTLGVIVFIKARQLAAEGDLLTAALSQAPDYAYVKDLHGIYTAANRAFANLHGFANGREIVGKTDHDLTTPERAEEIAARERQIVDSGEPQGGFEEQVTDKSGAQHWMVATKVPLYGSNGEAIGIAGVTRDITEDKQLRQDLIDSEKMLSYALAEMSDGLAVFDADGRIEFCNARYRESFPYTGNMRQPGAHMRDILRNVVTSGEQNSVPASGTDEWIETIVGNLRRESEEEVNLFNGRWLQVRTRPTSEGRTIVVVTDVTRIKQTELELQSASDQLTQLVRTDSLTGLLNRRAFDAAIETEISRSARSATPMSMLLIDVDRFKSYNDHYGHPAGDACLKLVSQHLQNSLKRPADMVARYGGEEFTAILPDTDEDGAYLVAESFRKALAAARLPHAGSDSGYVTASVGVATYMSDNLHRSTTEIVQAADEALYSAKAAGRDRVYGTRVVGTRARYAHE